eukprot:TRINITY_DN76230_c0_g1_i1.p1 TRINITY_DN76230_c0_g1~~TRINITY_DN76230_c0_g1_i1.p1  ORF type:complete len:133 (-),score=1.90 TRINITY_DN76230_c0_g1_i1:228-626(-)
MDKQDIRQKRYYDKKYGGRTSKQKYANHSWSDYGSNIHQSSRRAEFRNQYAHYSRHGNIEEMEPVVMNNGLKTWWDCRPYKKFVSPHATVGTTLQPATHYRAPSYDPIPYEPTYTDVYSYTPAYDCSVPSLQ